MSLFTLYVYTGNVHYRCRILLSQTGGYISARTGLDTVQKLHKR